MAYRFLVLLAFATFAGLSCSNTAIADLSLGPFSYSVDASQAMIPSQFVDSSNNTIQTIACQQDSDCPQLGQGQPAVHCTGSACTPDPFTFVLVSDVIDANQNATVQMYGNNVTDIEVRGAQFSATSMGLTNAVGPTDLFWGPETAVDLSSAGVTALGTIPVVMLSDGQTLDMQTVTLDSGGAAAFSQYLLNTSRRFKLLARPRITVTPGGPVPMGSVSLQIEMQVHIEGTIVR